MNVPAGRPAAWRTVSHFGGLYHFACVVRLYLIITINGAGSTEASWLEDGGDEAGEDAGDT